MSTTIYSINYLIHTPYLSYPLPPSPVSPPAVSTLAHPGDGVAALALLLAAVALLAAVQPVPPRPTLQLAVHTPAQGLLVIVSHVMVS